MPAPEDEKTSPLIDPEVLELSSGTVTYGTLADGSAVLVVPYKGGPYLTGGCITLVLPILPSRIIKAMRSDDQPTFRREIVATADVLAELLGIAIAWHCSALLRPQEAGRSRMATLAALTAEGETQHRNSERDLSILLSRMDPHKRGPAS